MRPLSSICRLVVISHLFQLWSPLAVVAEELVTPGVELPVEVYNLCHAPAFCDLHLLSSFASPRTSLQRLPVYTYSRLRHVKTTLLFSSDDFSVKSVSGMIVCRDDKNGSFSSSYLLWRPCSCFFSTVVGFVLLVRTLNSLVTVITTFLCSSLRDFLYYSKLRQLS